MMRSGLAAFALVALAACDNSAGEPQPNGMEPMGPMPMQTGPVPPGTSGGGPANSPRAELTAAIRCWVAADQAVGIFDLLAEKAPDDAQRQQMLAYSERSETVRQYYDQRVDELADRVGLSHEALQAEGEPIMAEFRALFDQMDFTSAAMEIGRRADACRNNIPAGQGGFEGGNR